MLTGQNRPGQSRREQNELDFLELIWGRAQTSPGRLAGIALGLGLILIICGLAAAGSVAERGHGLEATLVRAEPLSNATQELYSELSIADAVTGTVFLSPGLESAELRGRYEKAITTAGAASVVVAQGVQAAQGGQTTQLQIINEALPVYTALVESAKVSNRAGKPVGSAYLSEASNLMQTVILPAAERMHREQADALEAAQARQTRPPLLAIALIVVGLACLVLAQLHLARRSHRRLNPGLVLATGLLSVLLLWFLVTGAFLVAANRQAQREGAGPLRTLAAVRILTQQARTEETLQLLRRGDEDQLEQQYQNSIREVIDKLGRLDQGPAPQTSGPEGRQQGAAATAKAWRQAHSLLEQKLGEGKYHESVALAIGPGPQGCSAQYHDLDQAINADIEHSRHELRSAIGEAHEALTGLAPAAVLISSVGVALVCAGYWPRIGEYRG